MNGLLKVLNEKELDEIGMETVRLPLLSVFAASNETPAPEQGLDAFDDRLLIREMLSDITSDAAFERMLTQQPTTPAAVLTLDEIRAAQAAAQAVIGSRAVLDAILTLRRQCSEQGVVVSARRWKKSLALVKAAAWLDGERVAGVEHLQVLQYVLWRQPKDRATVERLVLSLANPLALHAVEILDTCREQLARLPKPEDRDWHRGAENALQMLTDAHTKLRGLITATPARQTQAARQTLATLESLHQGLAAALFASVSKHALAV